MSDSLARYLYSIGGGKLLQGSIKKLSGSANSYGGPASNCIIKPSSGKKIILLGVQLSHQYTAGASWITVSYVTGQTTQVEAKVILYQIQSSGAVLVPTIIDLSGCPVVGGVDQPIKAKTSGATHTATISCIGVEV